MELPALCYAFQIKTAKSEAEIKENILATLFVF